MGTAVHETVAHGLQRTDTVPIHAGGTPRLYTGLHEIEAYLAQRLFDPTLGEKYDAGGYGDDHDALEWIVQRVYRGYLGERPGPQPGTTQPSLIEAVRRRVQGWLGRDYSWEIYPGIEGQPGPALVYVKRPTRGQRTTLDAINRLRRRLGLEPLPASEAGRRRTATLPEPPEFTLDDDEDDPPRMSEIEGTPSIKPADQSSKMAPKMAPLVERLAQIAAAGRTPTREEILELQRNTPAMRSLKKADPKLRLLFNTELRKLTDAHDAALLQYIRDHHPQYAGRNLRVHDFRTPGTKDDGTAINTDRDYRVLCLDGEREREVPRRLWDHESHRLFASLTGYSPAKARALMTPEMQARWDRIPSRYPEPGKADARQVEMWAELHQWLATDVWHPEASLEFTDQPTYAYLPPLLRTPGADGRLIVEALKQIIAVTQHRTSVLLQPQRFGMMYNEKVDVYLRMGNKVEALAQLAKGIKMWRSVRRAYRLQGYGLPPLRLNFDLACESVSQLDPFDHTVTPDVLREFERRLQELGFSGIRALKDRLDFEFHSFIFLEEKGAQPRKPMPLADTGEGTSLAAPEAPNARAGEGGAWSVTPGVIPPDAAGPAQPASPVVDLSPLLERGAARRTLAHDIAPIAVAFDLRRWREHVRGDERGEGVLLELLRSSGIGGDVDEAAMAEELDRRLSGLPAPPTGMNVAALRDDLDASAGRWRANPGDIALAGRVLRLRTVLGGILGVPASPLSDVPLAALPLWAESPTADERAQMAVVSAARIARHPLVERDLRIHLDVLAASGTGAGDVPLAEARAALEHRDWSAFWPALIRAHDAVTSPLLREVCQ
jgi:hypothetical protein